MKMLVQLNIQALSSLNTRIFVVSNRKFPERWKESLEGGLELFLALAVASQASAGLVVADSATVMVIPAGATSLVSAATVTVFPARGSSTARRRDLRSHSGDPAMAA